MGQSMPNKQILQVLSLGTLSESDRIFTVSIYQKIWTPAKFQVQTPN